MEATTWVVVVVVGVGEEERIGEATEGGVEEQSKGEGRQGKKKM